MAIEEHFNILRQGAKVWNKWREENPDVQLDFRGANLTRKTFNDVHARAATIGIRLPTGPFPLIEANLSKVDLRGANLRGADLTETNLREADLTGAQLCYAHLVGTKLENANLSSCHIYGISTWDLKLEGADQSNLIITPPGEPTIKVDNLEVAQFIYLMLHNEKIGDVISAIGKKVVLILGRFGGGGLDVLQIIATELRKMDYLPIIFNFDRPEGKNYTETIVTLVGLSRFVIVDLSGPSVPLELYATVPHFKIPFVPIIDESTKPFSLNIDILEYPWVINPIVKFASKEHLKELFQSEIIAPAEKKHIARQKLLDQLYKTD